MSSTVNTAQILIGKNGWIYFSLRSTNVSRNKSSKKVNAPWIIKDLSLCRKKKSLYRKAKKSIWSPFLLMEQLWQTTSASVPRAWISSSRRCLHPKVMITFLILTMLSPRSSLISIYYKSPGPDGLPPRILRECATALSPQTGSNIQDQMLRC